VQPDVLTLVVIAANVIGGAMALPQAAKLHRTRRVDGVSPTWAAASATVNGCWAVYGWAVGDLGIVPVSVVSTATYLYIAVAVHRCAAGASRPTALRAIATAAAVTTVPLVALVLHGWVAAGLTLGALYGVQLLPAVLSVYRTVDVSGVSVATWSLALLEALLWGVYGAARIDAGLLALATTGTVMSTLVLVRLFLRRPRRTRYAASVGVSGLAPA
jgi:uncharacterized protein with PQ loop repeat